MTATYHAKMTQPQSLVEVYQLSRQAIYELSSGLSESQANWRPQENAQSITEILYHLTDAERYWLYKLNVEIPSPPKNVTFESTLAHLTEMETLITNLFSAKKLDDLTQTISTNRGDLSLVWALKRLTHHMNYHLSTLVYLRSIQEPEWAGEAGQKYWAQAVDAFSDLISTD